MIRFYAAAAAVAFALAGCSSPGVPGPLAAPPPVPASAPAPVAMVVPDPAYLDIPEIGAHSTLEPVGLNPNRTLQVPDVHHPRQAVWYSRGVKPGAVGPAAIDAHIDGDGQQGLFFHLRDLVPGNEFTIGLVDGRVLTFTVYKVMDMPKNAFDTRAVYNDTPDPEIRLITCSGSFDSTARSYRDNLVVFAKLTASKSEDGASH